MHSKYSNAHWKRPRHVPNEDHAAALGMEPPSEPSNSPHTKRPYEIRLSSNGCLRRSSTSSVLWTAVCIRLIKNLNIFNYFQCSFTKCLQTFIVQYFVHKMYCILLHISICYKFFIDTYNETWISWSWLFSDIYDASMLPFLLPALVSAEFRKLLPA